MSKATIAFHRLAALEFRQARARYAKLSRLTAVRFIGAVDIALEQIAEAPTRWPLYDDQHRWVKIKKFPFLLLFRIIEVERLTVIALAHTSRRSGYWRRHSDRSS